MTTDQILETLRLTDATLDIDSHNDTAIVWKGKGDTIAVPLANAFKAIASGQLVNEGCDNNTFIFDYATDGKGVVYDANYDEVPSDKGVANV